MPEAVQHNRLPRNFHRTFKPERQYITAMLRYAASDQEGDIQAIGAATGIPTGASTGKVPAILDYCRGMGLVRLGGPERSAVKISFTCGEVPSQGRRMISVVRWLETCRERCSACKNSLLMKKAL